MLACKSKPSVACEDEGKRRIERIDNLWMFDLTYFGRRTLINVLRLILVKRSLHVFFAFTSSLLCQTKTKPSLTVFLSSGGRLSVAVVIVLTAVLIYTLYDSQERLAFRYDSKTNVSSEYFYLDGKLIARRDQDRSDLSTQAQAQAEDQMAAQAEAEADAAAAQAQAEQQEAVATPAPTLPSSPSTLWPAGNLTVAIPEFKWSAVSGATHYFVDIRKADSDGVLKYKQFSASEAGCSDGTGDCRAQVSGSPLSGANRWRVMSENAQGRSDWSNWRAFNVRN